MSLKNLLLTLLFLIAPPVFASGGTCPSGVPPGTTQCYFVSYASGSDSNSGITEVSPWKLAPGMNGFAGTYSPAPGDGIILKGGDTWPMNTIGGGCWYLQNAGTSSNPIYFGVDKTWPSSWSRPILSANGATIPPITGSACPVTSSGAPSGNDFIVLDNNYITVDNFEITGALWLNETGSTCTGYCNYGIFLPPNSHVGDVVSNNYCHGWANAGGVSTTQSVDTGGCFIDNAQNSNLPYAGTALINNVVDGSDTPWVTADPSCLYDCHATTTAFGGYWSKVVGNIARYASQGFDGVWSGGGVTGADFHDNTVEWIRRSIDLSSGSHGNGVQFQYGGCGNFYNNIVRHSFLVAYPTDAYTTVGVTTESGCTTNIFNNVIYDTNNANCFDVAYLAANNSTLRGTQNVWNNTVQCGPDSTDKLTFAGTVTVSGASVSWVSGDKFPFGLDPSANGGSGGTIVLNSTSCTVSTINSAISITLSSPCGSSGSWTAFGTTASNGIPINGLPATPGNTCGTPACYTAVNVGNNHFITAAAAKQNCSGGGTDHCNFNGSTNITQSQTTANGQGYTISQTYAFSPTNMSNSTVGAGLNLTSGWPSTIPTSDTTYSCTYNSTNHTMNCPARTVNSRPISTAWDSGAYEFVPSGGPPYQGTQITEVPSPPLNLTAVLK